MDTEHLLKSSEIPSLLFGEKDNNIYHGMNKGTTGWTEHECLRLSMLLTGKFDQCKSKVF